jgi:hypothetical protein
MRGDGRQAMSRVPAAEQQAALDALLATLSPAALALPPTVLDQLPPRPAGYPRHRELFPRQTGLPFDPLSPALVAADHVVSQILDPERAARLVAQEALDAALPGLTNVIRALVDATFAAAPGGAYEAEIARTVQRVVADRLMGLAASAPMAQVRAIATAQLKQLRTRTTGGHVSAILIADDIQRFLDRPAEPQRAPATAPIPPGAPIGQMDDGWLRCDIDDSPLIRWIRH